jgi:hypothetical protein
MWLSRGKRIYEPPALTFPLGPRSDGGSRLRLRRRRGRFLGLLLTRSLLDSSPSRTSGFVRWRGFRRGGISRRLRRSRRSSARWPGAAVLSGVGSPKEGVIYQSTAKVLGGRNAPGGIELSGWSVLGTQGKQGAHLAVRRSERCVKCKLTGLTTGYSAFPLGAFLLHSKAFEPRWQETC